MRMTPSLSRVLQNQFRAYVYQGSRHHPASLTACLWLYACGCMRVSVCVCLYACVCVRVAACVWLYACVGVGVGVGAQRDLIPNRTLWVSLPGLAWDGWVYSTRMFRRKTASFTGFGIPKYADYDNL